MDVIKHYAHPIGMHSIYREAGTFSTVQILLCISNGIVSKMHNHKTLTQSDTQKYETIRTSRKLSKGKVLFWRPRGATWNYVLMNDTHLDRQIQFASQY